MQELSFRHYHTMSPQLYMKDPIISDFEHAYKFSEVISAVPDKSELQ